MWTTILWFLILGGIFYWMMRMGGCGAHGAGGHGGGMHGGGHDMGHGGNEPWTVEDPVCGARGPADPSRPSVEYGGRVYYFCSDRCRDQFNKNPEQYAKAQSSQSGGDHHG
jgi:Cu+-exporting ATPase